jgi:hypothetical protein
LAIVCFGVVVSSTAGLLFAWDLWEPIQEDTYGQNSDIAFNGTGPESTMATAKLRKQSTGIVQDTKTFTTNSSCADCGPTPCYFEGEFDISGQWATGTQIVEIWVSGTREFNDREIFIQ